MFKFNKARRSTIERENISFARKYNKPNNNGVIIGGIGCGKSLVMKKMIRDDHEYHQNDMQQFIIHSQDTYEDVMGSIGGTSIKISPFNRNLQINPLSTLYSKTHADNSIDQMILYDKVEFMIDLFSILAEAELTAVEKSMVNKIFKNMVDSNTENSLDSYFNIAYRMFEQGYDTTFFLELLDELKILWPGLFSQHTNVGSIGIDTGNVINYRFVIDMRNEDRRINAIEQLVSLELLISIIYRNWLDNNLKTTIYIDNLDELIDDTVLTSFTANIISKKIYEISKITRMHGAGIILSLTNIDNSLAAENIINFINQCEYNVLLHNTDEMLACIKKFFNLSVYQITQIDENHIVKPGDGIINMGLNKWIPCKVNIDYHYGYVD